MVVVLCGLLFLLVWFIYWCVIGKFVWCIGGDLVDSLFYGLVIGSGVVIGMLMLI